MKLINFRVRNFRSINDSGVIRMDEKIALVGRNESGKSNLLLALGKPKPGRRARGAFQNQKLPSSSPFGRMLGLYCCD